MKIDRLFVVSLGAITGLASCSSGQDEEAQRPNILILLADDAGYADFGFMGATDIQTPNIDRLAAEGCIFTDAGGDGEQPFAIHDADGPLRTTLRI